MTKPFWKLNDQEYFEAPGLSALVFHDTYPEGKQGGIEIIQHGERVAACGDVRLEPAPGQWRPLPEVGAREVDPATGTARVPLRFAEADIAYTMEVRPEGEALRIAVNLESPLPSEWEDKVGLNLELFPGAYFGKTFHLGKAARIFPRQANGPVICDGMDPRCLLPIARGPKLVAVPEDALRRLEIASETGELRLYDGRNAAQNGWFVVREVVNTARTEGAIVWMLRPHSVPGWLRAPVICVSQVGYHPDQVKQAIVELDPRTETLLPATLQRVDTALGDVDVLTTEPARWGRFLRYDYAVFDFTAVQDPGMYRVRYGEQVTPPFAIARDVYRHDVWQPTLETYFPVQMCHVEVRDGARVWHGACHLDDALQAPAPHEHFDGYRQYQETETPYAPRTHIPHLDQGGWHDAGDYDLAAGSQARTTHTLVLIRELLGVDTDQTTVDQALRLVHLHQPDGVPDIVEQVAHGALNLLSGYRAVGHSFHGIIAGTLRQYAHMGDAATMTDNRIYDPALAPGEVRCDEAGHIYGGVMDDRWAFTNHDTALEYVVAGALAASSRVLRGYEDDLAEECLATALKVWAHEQSHEPVEQGGGYVPRGVAGMETLAALELLITTGEAQYKQRLLDLWSALEPPLQFVAGTLARAVPYVDDEAFTNELRAALQTQRVQLEAELAENPFGVVFKPRIWGEGWRIQGMAVTLYHIWSVFPDLVDPEAILRVVNYVFGCHPGSNTSLTSGVGAKSLTVAYGANRTDDSYIPGGMASGTALIRPDFPELKEPWAYLWQQTEYVMSGAADYIFCVLAADRILNGGMD